MSEALTRMTDHLYPLRCQTVSIKNQGEETRTSFFQQLTQYRFNVQRGAPPQIISLEEMKIYETVLDQLLSQYQTLDLQFAQRIAEYSRSQQFVFTQQRWTVQMREAEELKKKLTANGSQTKPETRESLLRRQLRLTVGEYIQSPITGKFYLNLGVAAETIQGFIYLSVEFDDSFVDRALSYKPPFPSLIAISSANPRLAIKYYHKKSCVKGLGLCGKTVNENATVEMTLTERIYKNALSLPIVNQKLYSWLPAPHLNVIRCLEYWETEDRDAYYMVMEYANCGELLNDIDHIHYILNADKIDLIAQIQSIADADERTRNVKAYRGMLTLSPEHQNPHIEMVRFLFQQMVQAVATLHNQGVAHLDVSLENFVLHFGDDGQLLVKIIDLGRAKKMNKKQNVDTRANLWPYESFDFMVSTPPGKARYCSAAGALFMKYQDADPYDSSQEDVFALAVCLYTMLTANMPWDTPLYIEPDKTNPDYGYLNGAKKYKIDLTMRDAGTGPENIDPNFAKFQTAQGMMDTIQENCHLDYFSPSALDLLGQMFESKMTLKELAVHPFVSMSPDGEMLNAVLDQYARYRQAEYRKDQKHATKVAAQLTEQDNNWLSMKAAAIVIENRATRDIEGKRTSNNK